MYKTMGQVIMNFCFHLFECEHRFVISQLLKLVDGKERKECYIVKLVCRVDKLKIPVGKII